MHLQTFAAAAAALTLGCALPALAAPAAAPAPLVAAAAAAPVCKAGPWVADSNATSHATDLGNPSGTLNLKAFTLYFSPGGGNNVIYPVQWSWSYATSGNPVTVEVTANTVSLHITHGAPLHGVWNGRSARPAWTAYSRGFWAVVTCS